MTRTPLLILLLLLPLSPLPAMADSDHERARRALAAGQVIALRTILDQAESRFGARLIEAELEDRHGQPVYELKLITPEGRIIKALFDARDGSLIKSKEGRP